MISGSKNRAIKRINSWIFWRLDGDMHWLYGTHKYELLKNHPKTVLEIGAGCGANMRYLRPGTHLIAVEPNHYMHQYLRKKAEKHDLQLSIVDSGAEQLPYESKAVDMVLSALVLCSVNKIEEVLREIKRVLKSHRQFVFIEHVHARNNPFLARVQKLVYRPWRWFFDGCRCNQDTEGLLREEGFHLSSLRRFNLYTPFIPITPQIKGVALVTTKNKRNHFSEVHEFNYEKV